MQEVRWVGRATESAGEYKYVYPKRMRIMNYVQDFLCKKDNISS
jgi:hypothetical protein